MLRFTVSFFLRCLPGVKGLGGQGSASGVTLVWCQLSLGTAKCFYLVEGWTGKRHWEIDDLWVGSGVSCSGNVELCWLMTRERHSLFLWQILLLTTQSIYLTPLVERLQWVAEDRGAVECTTSSTGIKNLESINQFLLLTTKLMSTELLHCQTSFWCLKIRLDFGNV